MTQEWPKDIVVPEDRELAEQLVARLGRAHAYEIMQLVEIYIQRNFEPRSSVLL